MAGTLAISIVGIFVTLSFGPLSDFLIFNKTIYGWFDYISISILLPLGAIFIVLFLGWYLGKDVVKDELSNQGKLKLKFLWLFMFIIKFIAPIAITLVFLYGIGVLRF